MKLKSIQIVLIIFSMAFLSSCKKPEGKGGECTITGSVWTKVYNSTFTVLEGEFPATDEWVYIIYGDEVSYGDRIRTNYKGEFEFKYLRTGDYKLYVYSADSTLQSPSGEIAVVKDVHLGSKKQKLALDMLTIFK